MMMTPMRMREIEQAAFARGVTAESLMEEAAAGIAHAIRQFFPTPGSCLVYSGKGHNAGDAFLAARYLAEAGWNIFLRSAFPEEEMNLLTRSHFQALCRSHHVRCISEVPMLQHKPLVLLDGLLGIGAQGIPREGVAQLILEINQVRSTQGAFTVAVDVPSGLDATLGIPGIPCVQADLTVTIGYPKTGLVADTAVNHVGRLAVASLTELKVKEEEQDVLITTEYLKGILPPRSFNAHKGLFGRVGIIAGSRGYLGAANLASSASLHAGAGLVTLYALPEVYELLAVVVPPEVMVKPINSYLEIFSEKLDALAIGPGLGEGYHCEILEVIENFKQPCLVDADALNALAKAMPRLLKAKGPRLLTPHPGEMERLFPCKNRSRAAWAADFIHEYSVTLLLKGARTVIAEPDKPLAYNTTGNPGMASGGMGDVLTGVITAFLAGGKSLHHAAMLGVWLCGYAAELALFQGKASQESLLASDIITMLGRSMKALREGVY